MSSAKNCKCGRPAVLGWGRCRDCNRAHGRELAQKRYQTPTWEGNVPSLIKVRKPFPPETKTVYLDIETAGISRAEYNIVIAWALKEPGKEPISETITKRDLDVDNDISDPQLRADYNLLVRLMEVLKNYNRVVTWYGKGFDIPMLRTRCLILGIPFPAQWQFVHTDQYYLARNKHKFTRNRLAEVAKSLGCPYKGTSVTPKAWKLAADGHESGLNYVREHNEIDVRMLEFVDVKFQSSSLPTRSLF